MDDCMPSVIVPVVLSMTPVKRVHVVVPSVSKICTLAPRRGTQPRDGAHGFSAPSDTSFARAHRIVPVACVRPEKPVTLSGRSPTRSRSVDHDSISRVTPSTRTYEDKDSTSLSVNEPGCIYPTSVTVKLALAYCWPIRGPAIMRSFDSPCTTAFWHPSPAEYG